MSDYQDEFTPIRRKSYKVRNRIITIAAIVVTVVVIIFLVLETPIIRYEKTQGGTVTAEQISVMDYMKRWQPLVEEDGTLTKQLAATPDDLDLKEDYRETYDDGLDLEQTIEGQYTLLFLGMDESGDLSDVVWLFQFDIGNGTLNVLQIPRDCYMPDYASYSTGKFNSIYASGQETGVTPVQRVVDAIEDNFCIYIDNYVKLCCNDIAPIVDSIGGIPITLPEEIIYEADKILPAGEQVLNGEQSEWFIRFRHDYLEGDIGRMKAQRIFLAAAMEKLIGMSSSEIFSAMQEIYQKKWIATDLSLEEISMLADFSSVRLTLDSVNVYMVPGEAATYYPGNGTAQSVYSIHKNETIELLNESFRPYQNELFPSSSAIVELIPEGEYQTYAYDDTVENLEDISEGDTEDGIQMD